MDEAHLRKAFALIANGLVEKERLLTEQPTRYPYSGALHHGMNMFLAASRQYGRMGDAVFAWADEAAFLARFITHPIAEWFDGWDPEVVAGAALRDQPYYGCGALAYSPQRGVYLPSDECLDFLHTQDGDVIDGTDERILYEKMLPLDQDAYCRVRRFVIEHPILTRRERQGILTELAENQAARDALQFAYEEFREAGYRCPACGWTMTRDRYGLRCHSWRCANHAASLTEARRIDGRSGDLLRLKRGIMRYFAQPGKLELAIANFCETEQLAWSLWPQKDRYDIEIRFPDGDVWEIDAKAYRNPITLRNRILRDGGFPTGDFARGFYVIPTEYRSNQTNYLSIVDRCLAAQPNVACVTLRMLQHQIRRKGADCHGK